ncbi:hypothetical protein [Enterobacter hormaechei]|uniref:hypothetical protein n=1 Tax=Enterobacter hormaechei TaxID=158836 RepID=UPI0007961BC4|nr:hypothetical protein [Enterobacter hormaechei]ELN4416574.1 hypothetical protein [Enterobacter hormaechei]SAA30354.1 Uncharacterised protein [Enterobacter hormaechei]SAB05012.1 Uncharacterised protein [Enterobacter hormaechei]VAG27035.1 Uncharacterised protein [Enterobacter hormaechei]VAG86601.1 Uncharacterised protein [Enterobacter hormaechei]
MGFPSPAKDYAESRLTITSMCGYDGNCRTVETSAGYAIINVANKPHPGDTVLISYCGRTEFAIVQGRALIVPEGESIEGEALDDTTVLGVVTHFLNRAGSHEDDPIPVM